MAPTHTMLQCPCGRRRVSLAEMPASCWLKAVAAWPELSQRLEHNLDEAEKAFRARQRVLNLGEGR